MENNFGMNFMVDNSKLVANWSGRRLQLVFQIWDSFVSKNYRLRFLCYR